MAYDWTKSVLANTPWRIQVVADILPLLIRRAKEGKPISYGELAEQLQEEFGHEPQARKTLYGPPVGAIGLAIQELGERWGERIPPINTIVVRAGEGTPGMGADEIAHYFFEDNGRGMKQDREAYMHAAMDAVFAYGRRWDRVAQALGAPVLEPATDVIDEGEVIDLPDIPPKFAPESQEHKALKAWMAAHPEWLDEYGEFGPGRSEHPLSSGDRLDAYFRNGRQRLAVEVKTSHASDNEMKRGVYQCVKYRAVLRAEEQALRRAPNGDAVLVSTRKLGKTVKTLAKRLHVHFLLVPLEAEQP
jgi:hypothetical protein